MSEILNISVSAYPVDYHVQLTTRHGLDGVSTGGNSNYLNLSGGTLTGELSAPSISTDSIQLNITTHPSFSEGQVFYDHDWKTLAAQIDDSVTMQIGQEDLYYVYNNSTSNIVDGQAVYVTGSGSDSGVITDTVALARADNTSTSNVLGVATTPIPIGSYGYITSRGKINGFDTTSMGTAGNLLYLSPTVYGGLTQTLPEKPDLRVIVGRLLISHALSGRISVYPEKMQDSLESVAVSIASQIYFLPTQSITNVLYKELSYTNTDATSARSITVDATPSLSATLLSDQFVFDVALGLTEIPGGVWSFSVPSYVNTTSQITRIKVEVYLYHLGGSVTKLFEQYSGDINATILTDQIFSFGAPAYTVAPDDKLMVRMYGTTTRNGGVTIHYVLGDGNGAYMTTPLKLRHSLLTNFNEDPEVQHMNSTEANTLRNLEAGTVANDVEFFGNIVVNGTVTSSNSPNWDNSFIYSIIF